MSQSPSPKPPVAPKIPKRIEQLGRVRIDDYAWMKDDNWQKVLRDPSLIKADVKAHLDAENAYLKAMLASTEPLQSTLFEEMKGRIKQDDASVPTPDGAWDYYSRYETGGQHPIYARRRRGKADGEVVLLNADAESKGKGYYKVGGAGHSPDHKLFAWAVDEQGSEYYRIHVRDAGGAMLPGSVESAYGDFVFSPDSQWLFWIWRDENARPAKVFRRPARGGEDVLVYEEADDGMFLGLEVTADEKFILISIGDHDTTETRLIPAATPTATPVTAVPRKAGDRYELEHWTDRWVILTNVDGAIDFKLMVSDAEVPARATWRELVPHEAGRYIVGMSAFEGHLVRLERVNASNRLVVRQRDGAEHTVAFDEEAYALNLAGTYEYASPLTRFVYQSPTTPKQWFDYDMASRKRTLRKTQEVPSGHDPADYVARRLYAKATDGAEVPITVLMKKDTPLDGSAPLMVYGYGSYGIPMEPGFSTTQLSLVNRGWIWATAHIRGGSEKGWGWYLDGKLSKKKNTFTDFVDSTKHLLAEGYGHKDKVVAYGGSAGGLLVGAVANLAPETYAGIIGAVPFVDALNTISDATLPLTPPEWPEWGNPLTDPKAYDYIASYSPYDNVAARPYPAILATCGLSDPRVTYWEAEKWTAKLRDMTTSGDPILLKTNMEAGHGGASGRFDYLKEIALDYAFAIWATERGWAKG